MRTQLTQLRLSFAKRGIAATIRAGLRAAYCDLLTALSAPLRHSLHGDPFRALFDEFVAEANRASGLRILEIGARNVSGHTNRYLFGSRHEYVGFDYHAGDNVDVVGDAHELSRLVPAESFDVVFTIATFEHLLMPWQVVLEIAKVLKPGGRLFIATHPAWPAHERPWDFWRFSSESFDALLNRHTGFRILKRAEGMPAAILPLV
ncbi:MAG TPA: class I SAM-dependent methyltransferase, partial [Planctomycetota bacterium]|nr:class I SAM-dependent methyltransferase [Planctomycetota bacterium]